MRPINIEGFRGTDYEPPRQPRFPNFTIEKIVLAQFDANSGVYNPGSESYITECFYGLKVEVLAVIYGHGFGKPLTVVVITEQGNLRKQGVRYCRCHITRIDERDYGGTFSPLEQIFKDWMAIVNDVLCANGMSEDWTPGQSQPPTRLTDAELRLEMDGFVGPVGPSIHDGILPPEPYDPFRRSTRGYPW